MANPMLKTADTAAIEALQAGLRGKVLDRSTRVMTKREPSGMR